MGIKSFFRGGSHAGRGDQPSIPAKPLGPMNPKDYTWEEQLHLRDTAQWITGDTRDYGSDSGKVVN